MVRILSEGLLIGWGRLTLWILCPFLGSFLGLLAWYLIRAFVDLRMPEIQKVRAAREEDRQTILSLKARLCDALLERDKAQKAERMLREFTEEVRSSNRNLNARATSVLGV
jgi:hypothetical protein